MYTAADENRANSLWKRYAVTLSLILAIIVTTHIIESQSVKSAQADAELINMSGKQRMLSQQMLLYIQVGKDDPNPIWQEKLAARVEQFEAAHTVLVNQAWDHPQLERVYFHGAPSLNSQIDTFLGGVRRILREQETDATIDKLLEMGTGPLLTALDDAVLGFESAANARAGRMHQLQEITLIIGALVLLLEALFIFAPAHRIVQKALLSLRSEVTQRQASNKRLSDFIDVASDLYWETDLEGHVEFVEGRFLDRMKGTRKDLLGCNFGDLFKMDEANAEALLVARENLSNYHDVRAEFTSQNGERFLLSLSGKARYDANGELLGYLGKAQDITQDANRHGEAYRPSGTDPLTNLRNKRGFAQDFAIALETASPLSPVSLLVVDLDRFKLINDAHGNGAGDYVLKVVASRIQSVLRSEDWVARTAGDEFCVVCADGDAESMSSLVAQRIIDAVTQPIKLQSGKFVSVDASIGIADAPTCGRDINLLQAAANAALEEAQKSGTRAIQIAAGPEHAEAEKAVAAM